MPILIAFISGLVMSFGLIISGMIYPSKVLGFLDIFGSFDLSLGFVMAGALLVTGIGYRLSSLRAKPVCNDCFNLPTNTKIDAPLILGATIFGIGWGLVGFCPAPAIVGIGLLLPKAIIFVLAMLIGMFIAGKIKNN